MLLANAMPLSRISSTIWLLEKERDSKLLKSLSFVPKPGYTLFFFSNLFLSRVINDIFSKIDEHIEKETLITELNLSSLPDLYGQFVQLIEYLVRSVALRC